MIRYLRSDNLRFTPKTGHPPHHQRTKIISRVFYIHVGARFWIDVARILRDEKGWEPAYWVATQDMAAAVVEAFPDVVCHHTFDAIKSIPPRQYAGLKPRPLDDDVLNRYKGAESLVLKMMDRMAPNESFRYDERIRHYHRLLKYWLEVLTIHQPEAVVFRETPHMVYDYVIYSICREKNIRTLMFEVISDLGVLIPASRPGEASERLGRFYAENLARLQDDCDQNQRVHEYFDKFRGDHRAALRPNLVKVFTRDDRSLAEKAKGKIRRPQEYPEFILDKARSLASAVTREVRAMRTDPNHYQKLKNHGPEQRSMSHLEWRWHRYRGRFKKSALERLYASLSTEPDYGAPYVFLPLQYQPEKTSSPEGGNYVYQDLLVEMLSSHLPADWKIYVKENPAQFLRRGEHSRNENFYRDIAALDNVRFVPLSTPTFDLIDNARAVATIKGTSGWEAVVRGVPALVSDSPWYRHCDGVFPITNHADCAAAIDAIEAGVEIDESKVKLFIHAACQFGFSGYSLDKHNHWGVPAERNARTVADALSSIA